MLLLTIITSTSHRHFFYESKGKPLTQTQIEQMVLYLTTKYRIKEVYTTQLSNVFEQADYEETTCRLYKNAFLTFLAYCNFKHPAWLKNQQIKKKLHVSLQQNIRTLPEYSHQRH